MRHDLGRDNCFFLHVSLVPYIGPSGELKTKPTQHSVAALRSIGIQPDAIVCRADREIPESVKRKISLMCDVDEEAVVAAVDAPSIYDIPKVLHSRGARRLRRTPAEPAVPRRRLDRVGRPAPPGAPPDEEVTVALVGKYIDLPDAYLSVAEALRAGGFAHEAKVEHRLGASDECETPEGAARHLVRGRRGAACPAASASAASTARSARCSYARTHGIPTLGLCLGLQCMVIEYARNVVGLEKAGSTEFDPDCPEPVIATMAEQHAYVDGAGDLGGTMRLGLYPAELKEGSVVAEAYGDDRVDERHRHRYEVNNAYREQLEERRPGLLRHRSRRTGWSSTSSCPRDVHPYYVSTQAHPELRSRPTRPHPLFAGLVGAAIARQKELLSSRSTTSAPPAPGGPGAGRLGRGAARAVQLDLTVA